MMPKYVVTEVLVLYLVLDLSLKHSVKHVLTVIFLDEVDKLGQNSFYWDPFAALLEVLGLWGGAFGKGMVERWKEIGRGSSRRRRGDVDHDHEWDGSENVNRMCLREEVLYGLRPGCELWRRCMTSRNFWTWNFSACACLVKFQMMNPWLFSFRLCCHYQGKPLAFEARSFNQWWNCCTKSPVCKRVTPKWQVKPSYSQ